MLIFISFEEPPLILIQKNFLALITEMKVHDYPHLQGDPFYEQFVMNDQYEDNGS